MLYVANHQKAQQKKFGEGKGFGLTVWEPWQWKCKAAGHTCLQSRSKGWTWVIIYDKMPVQCLPTVLALPPFPNWAVTFLMDPVKYTISTLLVGELESPATILVFLTLFWGDNVKKTIHSRTLYLCGFQVFLCPCLHQGVFKKLTSQGCWILTGRALRTMPRASEVLSPSETMSACPPIAKIPAQG